MRFVVALAGDNARLPACFRRLPRLPAPAAAAPLFVPAIVETTDEREAQELEVFRFAEPTPSECSLAIEITHGIFGRLLLE
jgi:NADPH-dependent ferric siderophore reductase